MVHVKVNPPHQAHPQEIHEFPKGAQALGFDFGWGREYYIVEKGGGGASVLFFHGDLPDVDLFYL